MQLTVWMKYLREDLVEYIYGAYDRWCSSGMLESHIASSALGNNRNVFRGASLSLLYLAFSRFAPTAQDGIAAFPNIGMESQCDAT